MVNLSLLIQLYIKLASSIDHSSKEEDLYQAETLVITVWLGYALTNDCIVGTNRFFNNTFYMELCGDLKYNFDGVNDST